MLNHNEWSNGITRLNFWLLPLPKRYVYKVYWFKLCKSSLSKIQTIFYYIAIIRICILLRLLIVLIKEISKKLVIILGYPISCNDAAIPKSILTKNKLIINGLFLKGLRVAFHTEKIAKTISIGVKAANKPVKIDRLYNHIFNLLLESIL